MVDEERLGAIRQLAMHLHAVMVHFYWVALRALAPDPPHRVRSDAAFAMTLPHLHWPSFDEAHQEFAREFNGWVCAQLAR
jgi:hypothetical protein